MNHFNEPWKPVFIEEMDFYDIHDNKDREIAIFMNHIPERKEFSARAATCVNFCQGFPTDWLNSIQLKDLSPMPSLNKAMNMDIDISPEQYKCYENVIKELIQDYKDSLWGE